MTTPAPRKPSGGRPPPTFAPGMPVRSGQTPKSSVNHHSAQLPAFIQPSQQQPQQQHHHRLSQPPPSHQARTHLVQPDLQARKMSMQAPAPAPPHLQGYSVSPRSTPSGRHLPRPAPSSSSHGSSTVSSAKASPNPSLVSSDGSLRESTRHNIIRPRRQDTAESAWEESLKTPKEDWVEVGAGHHHSPGQRGVRVVNELDMHFDHLLDSLQVPSSVRQKFATVSPDVKSSILTSSMNSNPTILSSLGLPLPPSSTNNTLTSTSTPKIKKRMSTPLLRKAKSSSSLGSPGKSPEVGKAYKVSGEAFTIVASPLSSPDPTESYTPGRPGTGGRGMSTGPHRPLSTLLFSPTSSSSSIPSFGRGGGKGLGIAMGEQPDAFISWLRQYKGTDLRMDVGRAKKLRMLLRHENTTWVAGFLEQGGYGLVLDRLQDVLDVEWREEQHDDQMLHELLRIVKALSTSEIGKHHLRLLFPRPFPALSSLLFSEKKPGDLPIRQIIVELWLFLFDLFPASASASSASTSSASAIAVRQGGSATEVDVAETVRGLLIPDLPDPTKEQHDFITQSHRPRVFKAWVGELSDICRDYFWITCHGSNTLWALDEVDPALVEKPVAPGGATGGVEFEAMNYVSTHFKLLNAICASLAKTNMDKARQLHDDLLLSGMDRILVTFRKASTTYYPVLHLELARYVHLLRLASPNARLPHLIDKMVGSPPEEVRRRVVRPQQTSQVTGVAGGRRGGWDPQL